MNVNIPDHIDGKSRRKALELYPVVYAFWKFKGNVRLMSEFLGVSHRCMYDRIRFHDELKFLLPPEKKIINEKEFDDFQVSEKRETGVDPIYKIYRYHLERSKKTFWWTNLNEEQRKKAEEKIRALYYSVQDEKFKLK